MRKYELFEDYFVCLGTNGNTDVIVNFYEFLEVKPTAEKSEIFNAYQKKSSEFLRNEDISLQEKQEERKTLDRIYGCLLYDDKNRQIYDERLAKIKEKNISGYKKFFNTMKKYKLERTSKEVEIKDASDLKKKIIKIIALLTTLGVFVGGVAHYANNITDEKVSDDPSTSVSEFYTDADTKMETIEYLVEPGSNISSVADIADELGISKEQCIQVGDIKIDEGNIIFMVKVPENIAKEYNSSITMQYKTVSGDYSENEIGEHLEIPADKINIIGNYNMKAGDVIKLRVNVADEKIKEKVEDYMYYNEPLSKEEKQKLATYSFYVSPGQDIKDVCKEEMKNDPFLNEIYNGDFYKLADAVLDQNKNIAKNYASYQAGTYNFDLSESDSAKITHDMLDRYGISLDSATK